MVVPDATIRPLFADNPLVTDAPFIRSYLGVPLHRQDGYNPGALCSIDTKARHFDAAQIQIMKSFAARVMDEMESRLIAQSDFLTRDQPIWSRRCHDGFSPHDVNDGMRRAWPPSPSCVRTRARSGLAAPLQAASVVGLEDVDHNLSMLQNSSPRWMPSFRHGGSCLHSR
jgi:hypothetical protein